MCQYITVHCLSDVMRWTRDRALRRYFDCAPRMSDSVTPIGPTRCPAARQQNRRVPPRTTACARQASGAIPERPRAHRASSSSRAPRNARQSGGEAQPGGCAIRVRRPPQAPRFSGRPRAATIGFGAEPKPGAEQEAAARETKRDAAIRSRIPRRRARPHLRGRSGDQPPDWG